jgi:predicted membrane-bound spermidine synthase
MGLSLLFLGCHAMAVQMLLMREMLAAFSGNELTVGAAFGVWFAAISAGALAGRAASHYWNSNSLRAFFNLLLLILAVLPPLLLLGLIRSRDWLGVAPYASLPFDQLVRLFLAILGPVCLAQGAAFPCACRLAGEGRKLGVSRLYGFESLGGLLGGLGFGVAMLYGVSSLAVALAASALGFAALSASLLTASRRWAVAAAAVGTGLLPLLFPLHVDRVMGRWEAARWSPSPGAPAEVAARVESPYQRLTVIRMGAQSMLYGNGQPLFMFPDPVQSEPLIHGILARHAAPRSVLLIGGNPAGLGRALLAHPGCSVTYVDMDPWIWRLTADAAFIEAAKGRVRVSTLDPVWFARQAAAASYDIVILRPPSSFRRRPGCWRRRFTGRWRRCFPPFASRSGRGWPSLPRPAGRACRWARPNWRPPLRRRGWRRSISSPGSSCRMNRSIPPRWPPRKRRLSPCRWRSTR